MSVRGLFHNLSLVPFQACAWQLRPSFQTASAQGSFLKKRPFCAVATVPLLYREFKGWFQHSTLRQCSLLLAIYK